jgi:hypothetical protein
MADHAITIHYVYDDPAGPIPSGGDGVVGRDIIDKIAPGQLAAPGTVKKLRIACNPKAVPDYWHRVTGDATMIRMTEKGPQFHVTCPDCVKTPKFQEAALIAIAEGGPQPLRDAQGKCC